MQLLRNRISSRSPLERPAIRVVCGNKLVDALDEVFDAAERAAPEEGVSGQLEADAAMGLQAE